MASPSSAASSSPEYVSKKSSADAAFRDSKFAIAASLYGELIALDPSNHIPYSNRSACYSGLNQFKEALVDAETCTSINPTFAKGFFRASRAYFGLKDYTAASVCLSKCNALAPSDSDYAQLNNEIFFALSEKDHCIQYPPFGTYDMMLYLLRTRQTTPDIAVRGFCSCSLAFLFMYGNSLLPDLYNAVIRHPMLGESLFTATKIGFNIAKHMTSLMSCTVLALSDGLNILNPSAITQEEQTTITYYWSIIARITTQPAYKTTPWGKEQVIPDSKLIELAMKSLSLFSNDDCIVFPVIISSSMVVNEQPTSIVVSKMLPFLPHIFNCIQYGGKMRSDEERKAKFDEPHFQHMVTQMLNFSMDITRRIPTEFTQFMLRNPDAGSNLAFALKYAHELTDALAVQYQVSNPDYVVELVSKMDTSGLLSSSNSMAAEVVPQWVCSFARCFIEEWKSEQASRKRKKPSSVQFGYFILSLKCICNLIKKNVRAQKAVIEMEHFLPSVAEYFRACFLENPANVLFLRATVLRDLFSILGTTNAQVQRMLLEEGSLSNMISHMAAVSSPNVFVTVLEACDSIIHAFESTRADVTRIFAERTKLITACQDTAFSILGGFSKRMSQWSGFSAAARKQSSLDFAGELATMYNGIATLFKIVESLLEEAPEHTLTAFFAPVKKPNYGRIKSSGIDLALRSMEDSVVAVMQFLTEHQGTLDATLRADLPIFTTRQFSIMSLLLVDMRNYVCPDLWNHDLKREILALFPRCARFILSCNDPSMALSKPRVLSKQILRYYSLILSVRDGHAAASSSSSSSKWFIETSMPAEDAKKISEVFSSSLSVILSAANACRGDLDCGKFACQALGFLLMPLDPSAQFDWTYKTRYALKPKESASIFQFAQHSLTTLATQSLEVADEVTKILVILSHHEAISEEHKMMEKMIAGQIPELLGTLQRAHNPFPLQIARQAAQVFVKCEAFRAKAASSSS